MNYLQIAASLRKLADVCPQCGSSLALNNQFSTECPNANCPNYSVLQDQRVRTMNGISPIPPVGTMEYNREFVPDVTELPFNGRIWNMAEIGLLDPIKYELSTLLGNKIYVVQIPLPFRHTMIPTTYKSNASSSLVRININNSDVFVHHNDENTYYMKDVAVFSHFLDGLNTIFGKPQYQTSDQLQQLVKKQQSRDLARHPIHAPLQDKLL